MSIEYTTGKRKRTARSRSLERLVQRWKREAIQLRREVTETNLRYHDLLMAVERKFDGETRHQTARRYICEAEERATSGPTCESPNDKVSYHADNAGGAHGKNTNDK